VSRRLAPETFSPLRQRLPATPVRPHFRVVESPLALRTSLLLLGLVVVTLTASSAPAQTGEITGTVTDAGSGHPVASVQVSIDGTLAGALTGPRGDLRIRNVPAGLHEVRFTLLGYETLEREVTIIASGAAASTTSKSRRSASFTGKAIGLLLCCGEMSSRSKLRDSIEPNATPAKATPVFHPGSLGVLRPGTEGIILRPQATTPTSYTPPPSLPTQRPSR